MLPPISELYVADILNRGVPNMECIVLRTPVGVELSRYALTLGTLQADNSVIPMNDCLFYFGKGYVRAGDWIFVYTGPGVPQKLPQPDGTNLYMVHWGRDRTVFSSNAISAVLFRMDGASISEAPKDREQRAAIAVAGGGFDQAIKKAP